MEISVKESRIITDTILDLARRNARKTGKIFDENNPKDFSLLLDRISDDQKELFVKCQAYIQIP